MDNFSNDIQVMTGKKPNIWFRICWKYISPAVTIMIILANVFQWTGISYNNIPYPWWAELVGWVVSLSTIALIPGVALYEMWRTPGSLKEVRIPNEYTL